MSAAYHFSKAGHHTPDAVGSPAAALVHDKVNRYRLRSVCSQFRSAAGPALLMAMIALLLSGGALESHRAKHRRKTCAFPIFSELPISVFTWMRSARARCRLQVRFVRIRNPR